MDTEELSDAGKRLLGLAILGNIVRSVLAKDEQPPETCRNCGRSQIVPGGNYAAYFCRAVTPRMFVQRVPWFAQQRSFPRPQGCPGWRKVYEHR